MIRKLHSLSCVLSFFLSDIIILFERRLRLYDANPLCFPASRGSYRSSSRLFFFIKEYKDKYFSAFKLLWINAWSTDRASGSLGENSLSLKVAISGIVKLIFVSQALNSVSFYCLFFSLSVPCSCPPQCFSPFTITPSALQSCHHPRCWCIYLLDEPLIVLWRRNPASAFQCPCSCLLISVWASLRYFIYNAL